MVYATAAAEPTWQTLKSKTVIKVDGEQVPFYLYKIDLVLAALSPDETLKNNCDSRLSIKLRKPRAR
ncbi:hypothetical protein HU830_02530 [Lactobacillus sp. DCY120]|uniref:Uncharacterized protein n=1 Tax=Bombilactobacillus apium TaxID=2675299 RepID=A0A850R694_9LACO|nr:hypothetical protein [Bombilactobacillus apium]NVY96065.1 hypothetical protein [Bombilactobacillus apium]